MNCNEGGCPRCNSSDEREICLCLHAEENALLEAGRERVGGATLYCNTLAQKFYFDMVLIKYADVHVLRAQ
jgi:deoxycytidylate deaminase